MTKVIGESNIFAQLLGETLTEADGFAVRRIPQNQFKKYVFENIEIHEQHSFEVNGKNIEFENVRFHAEIEFDGNGQLSFKNCTFYKGVACLRNIEAKFESCTFGDGKTSFEHIAFCKANSYLYECVFNGVVGNAECEKILCRSGSIVNIVCSAFNNCSDILDSEMKGGITFQHCKFARSKIPISSRYVIAIKCSSTDNETSEKEARYE
jgi:hypothetical protein